MEFYGYKKCSTCRNAHKLLLQHGVDVPFEDFVVSPLSKERITELAERVGGVLNLVNPKGTVYRDLGLKEKNLTSDEWVNLLHENGKLFKRPILITDQDVVVGFQQAEYERVIEQLK